MNPDHVQLIFDALDVGLDTSRFSHIYSLRLTSLPHHNHQAIITIDKSKYRVTIEEVTNAD